MDDGRSADKPDQRGFHSSHEAAGSRDAIAPAGAPASTIEKLDRQPHSEDGQAGWGPGPAARNTKHAGRSDSHDARREPSAPASGPGKPPEPRRMVVRGHTLQQRIVLALALILGTVGAALPAVLLIWLVFALLAMGVTAEVLEHTGGLAPTTFGGGFVLAVLVDALVVLWCLVKLARRRPARWRPLVVLIVVYTVLLWGLIPLDWAGVFDVPDAITTFAVLGSNFLITYVLPFVLFSLMIRGLLHTWRVANESATTAVRVTALAACLGMAGLSVTIALAAARADGYFDALTPGGDEMSALDARGVEGERLKLADLSADIGPPAPLLAGSDQNRFGTCAEMLADESIQGRPMVELAILRLVCAGASKPDAERDARDTLFWICVRHTRTPAGEPAPRYRSAVSALGDRYRWSRRDQDLPATPMSCNVADWNDGSESADLDKLDAMHTAFDRLEPDDQRILDLRYVDGVAPARLGRRLGKDESTARTQLRRARNRLWSLFDDVLAGR